MINSTKLVFCFMGFLKLGQKYKNIFVDFLVQMKTLEFASKIKQPLLGVQAEVKLGVQFAFDILSSEGCESDSFFSKIHRKVSRIFNFQFRSHNFHNCVISYSVWRKGNEQNSIRLVKESSEGCESNNFFSIFFFHFKFSRIF